jgi:hypothetical protein
VTLAFTNGATAVRQVSPSVANFAQTKVGDMVSLAFEDRLTFVLSGPEYKDARRPRYERDGRRGRGWQRRRRLGRSGGRQLVGDRRQSVGRHDLADQSGGGEVRTYNVTTPEGRAQLPRVKPGDSVTAINSSVAVIAITPKSERRFRACRCACPGAARYFPTVARPATTACRGS